MARRMNCNTGCYMHLMKLRIFPSTTSRPSLAASPARSQAELRERIAEGRRLAEERVARLRAKGLLPHYIPPKHQKVSELPSIKSSPYLKLRAALAASELETFTNKYGGEMGVIIHSCEVPGCPIKGIASKMFNLKKLPGKPLVVVCAKHARMARKEGTRAYNLASTFKYEASRAKEREAAAAFIRSHSRKDGRGYGFTEMAKIHGSVTKNLKERLDEKVSIADSPSQETGKGAGDEAGRERVRPEALAA